MGRAGRWIEYLPTDGVQWQLAEIDHDPDETVALTTPPLGIEGLRRASLKRKIEDE
ncbi:MAG TPA: hypothetical protein HPP87_04655 [Planctomycetes bacterium]|nr:hypothetical protein [Planctomycetota bacterium]